MIRRNKLRYIFKNIKNTVAKAPLLAFLMVLCLSVSTFVILYSHGAFQNYEAEKTIEDKKLPDDGAGGHSISIRFDEIDTSGRSTVGEMKQVISMLSDDAKSGFTGFYIGIFVDLSQAPFWVDFNREYFESIGQSDFDPMVDSRWFPYIDFRLEYHKETGQYGLYQEYLKNAGLLSGKLPEGRYFTEEEWAKGAYVMTVADEMEYLVGQEVEFYGNTYMVIGGGADISVPFMSMPDDVRFREVVLMIDEGILTTPVYNELRGVFESVYGDRIAFPELDTADVTEIYFYNTLMWVSVIIAVISAINLAILFRYILNTRRRSLSIMRICGYTKNKARRMYVAEIMLISVAIYWLCAGLFHELMLPQLVKVYEHITDVYSIRSYLIMFGIYIAAIYSAINAMTIVHVRSTPIGTLKERGR